MIIAFVMVMVSGVLLMGMRLVLVRDKDEGCDSVTGCNHDNRPLPRPKAAAVVTAPVERIPDIPALPSVSFQLDEVERVVCIHFPHIAPLHLSAWEQIVQLR